MRERKRCLKIVSKLGDAIVDPILQDLGREQPWYYVRNLLNLLSEAPKNEAVETLARYINHRDERVRKSTVTALCKNGSPRAQQVLVEALDDSDESIVRLAVSFLGQCRAKAAAPTLINKLSDKNLVDHNPDLACEMIFALGRTGAQEASDVLCNLIGKTGIFGIFQKRNDDILVAVFKATASLRDPKGAAIAGKFVRDKNPEVARAAKLATQSVG
jgi:HEAT repeat protein